MERKSVSERTTVLKEDGVHYIKTPNMNISIHIYEGEAASMNIHDVGTMLDGLTLFIDANEKVSKKTQAHITDSGISFKAVRVKVIE